MNVFTRTGDNIMASEDAVAWLKFLQNRAQLPKEERARHLRTQEETIFRFRPAGKGLWPREDLVVPAGVELVVYATMKDARSRHSQRQYQTEAAYYLADRTVIKVMGYFGASRTLFGTSRDSWLADRQIVVIEPKLGLRNTCTEPIGTVTRP